MRILFAPDSFKGSLTSGQQGILLNKAARKVFPGCKTQSVSMADGGEGTMSAVTESLHGKIRQHQVHDPLGTLVNAEYGVLDSNTVILEMAQMSGLTLVPEKERNPLLTSSVGTGEMVAHILNQGYRQILLAIGGSATNDGGMGAATALGIRFLDENGDELTGNGRNLKKVRTIDDSCVHPLLKQAQFTIMCDVDNPLLGSKGATYIYGPQKGASDQDMLEKLEEGMKNYNSILNKAYSKNYSDMPGAGAAGGISIPFLTFSNAELKPGIRTVFEALGFEKMLENVDLVVTGEGRVDDQSAFGKVLYGVGTICKKHGIPAVALAGCLSKGYETIYEHGICSVFTIPDGPMSLEESMENSQILYEEAAERMFRFIKTGMEIRDS